MSLTDVVHKHELRTAGAVADSASAFVLLLHGRGATAESMLPLGEMVGLDGFCHLAPQAEGFTWYPQSFMAPESANEPCLSASLQRIAMIISDLLAVGVEPDRLAIVGFSQGACLAAETVLRNPRPYGFLGILSGGAIGPPGTVRNYSGSLVGVHAFLGCADRDPHIPLTRVQETTGLLRDMGAEVSERIYPGSAHGVNDDELLHLRAGMAALSV